MAEIIAGEGRFRAWRKLWTRNKSEKWKMVPANIMEDSEGSSEPVLTFKEARDYILPLRIWPSAVPKDKKNLDLSLYDYTECTRLIDKLAAGEFHNAWGYLAAYVREVREANAQLQAEARLRYLVDRETAALREQLDEKDKRVKKLKAERLADNDGETPGKVSSL